MPPLRPRFDHLALLLSLLSLVALLPVASNATHPELGDARRPDDVGAGTLLIRDGNLFREAPVVSTDVVVGEAAIGVLIDELRRLEEVESSSASKTVETRSGSE